MAVVVLPPVSPYRTQIGFFLISMCAVDPHGHHHPSHSEQPDPLHFSIPSSCHGSHLSYFFIFRIQRVTTVPPKQVSASTVNFIIANPGNIRM